MARTVQSVKKEKKAGRADIAKKSAKKASEPRKSIAKKVPRASAAEAKKARKPHKWRPGTVALREIKYQQKQTENAIPKAPFGRLAKEVCCDILNNHEGLRWQADAIERLQVGSEAFLIDLNREMLLNMVHANRKMIMRKDLKRALSSINRWSPADAVKFDLGTSEDPNQEFVLAALAKAKLETKKSKASVAKSRARKAAAKAAAKPKKSADDAAAEPAAAKDEEAEDDEDEPSADVASVVAAEPDKVDESADI